MTQPFPDRLITERSPFLGLLVRCYCIVRINTKTSATDLRFAVVAPDPCLCHESAALINRTNSWLFGNEMHG